MSLTRLTALMFIAACPLCGAAPAASVAPNDPRIAYMGRVELTPTKAAMGFPAITVRFAFRGPAPTLRLSGDSPNCYFNLSCNGWDPVVIHLKQGANEIALPTGPAPGEGWVVELVRRTESWMGTASFDGLELPAGCEILSPPAPPQRKLMFIGDSLTCGEYNERFAPENDSTARSTNAARSYGMLIARWLGAQVHLVSYGGRGITRDWSGKTDVNIVPVFFERTLPDTSGSVWDHSRYQPDVIVINDGTDFDAGPQDEARFTDAYAAFVARVRSVYPKAYILLTESGFQSDGSDGRPTAGREQLLRTIKAIVLRQNSAGDRRIAIARSGFFPGTATNPHLVAFQHEQIALDLLGPVRTAGGW
jgi:Carbohydrate esterase 2 N-terminal/GDSL-like Lipase/Acylhydrolase family